MAERIQKILSRAGYGSCREIERWVKAGEITVNGVVATTGQAVDETDKVVLRGQVLKLANKLKSGHIDYKKPLDGIEYIAY